MNIFCFFLFDAYNDVFEIYPSMLIYSFEKLVFMRFEARFLPYNVLITLSEIPSPSVDMTSLPSDISLNLIFVFIIASVSCFVL